MEKTESQVTPIRISKRREFLHWAFDVGVILKGIDGAVEALGGSILLFIPAASISRWMVFLIQGELSEDPQDLIAGALLHLSQNLSSSAKLFGALYLLSHGIIKIGLVVALLKKRLWAYPVSIAFFLCFIAYQFYRLHERYSLGMTLLTVLDIVVLYLVWHEYKFVKSKSNTSH